ncbi:MAG: flavin reductase family protein [Deltaproteobacteria bacterium HGW-Deltaproteobacteria-15]|jgi:flavin reductase (DIM6/NTAB) family NADH-FMN oxidoreductase RutF|nr:MAG: flavin reductase family protein [Deltaproteobacteria bacterium HGW-Deltaproteobacteria-15]
MHYDPEKDDHGLAYSPFKSCVVPRPIGWISTVSGAGVHNLAPFSQFQNLTFDPPYVMFAANQKTNGGRKDTVVNTEETHEFVYNMATYDLREAVNLSAAEVPPEVDEFDLAKVTKTPSMRVKPCRVAESPVQFECRYTQTVRLPGNGVMGTVDIVIGRVVLIHIKDDVIKADGRLDIVKIRPLARLGYYDYTTVDSLFEMQIPGDNIALLTGLEGSAGRAPGKP